MKKEIKKEWIKRLRTKTVINRFLKTDKGFSPFGHLCEIYREACGSGDLWQKNPLSPTPSYAILKRTWVPPSVVLAWAGISETKYNQTIVSKIINQCEKGAKLKRDKKLIEEIIQTIEKF